MEKAFEGIRNALVEMKRLIEKEVDIEIEKSKGIGKAFVLRQQVKDHMNIPHDERRATRKAASEDRQAKRLKAINER